MKVRPVGAKLLCAGQTYMTKLVVTFHNSGNKPNKKHSTKLYYKLNTVPECHFCNVIPYAGVYVSALQNQHCI
jgi:hypothetical protein